MNRLIILKIGWPVLIMVFAAGHLNANPIYQVTRSLWSQQMKPIPKQGHARGRGIRLEDAQSGTSTPLHQGAIQFYGKIGMMTL